jgi:ParB/RepB/Spo0J family partition protein
VYKVQISWELWAHYCCAPRNRSLQDKLLIPRTMAAHYCMRPRNRRSKRVQAGVVEGAGLMRLEWHQLELGLEHLRVRRPERYRRLLGSLAASGQQTPIIVVAAGQPDHYMVIDGYQRVAALRQLGRDTVEAVVWSLSEGEALLLDRSLRSGPQETALEEGWLLVELDERFGYGQEELARRFDRSVSWVSRRMGLVELLPASVQQHVRSGAMAAHVAMKYLVPMARSHADDCVGMAEAIAKHRLSCREAGQLYAAWREASAAVRARLIAEPQLLLKTQRVSTDEPPLPAIAEVERDLDVTLAILRRARRRLRGVTVELDREQCRQLHGTIRRVEEELSRLGAMIPQARQGGEDVESESADRDPGAVRPGSEPARDRAGVEDQPGDGEKSTALRPCGGAADGTSGEVRALAATDPGVTQQLQGQPGPSAGGVIRTGSASVVLGADGLLPAAWNRPGAGGAGGPLPLFSG